MAVDTLCDPASARLYKPFDVLNVQRTVDCKTWALSPRNIAVALTRPRCPFAAVAFADPAKYAGKQVPVVSEYLSWPQAAEILTKVTGIPVKCAPWP